jgi:hypothetical protein
MAKATTEWTVLPHGPIEKLAENLWRVEGALPRMTLRRVMTLARMNDGRLVVHNAISLDEPSMMEIEAWGTPSFLIVPNGFHRLDAPAYRKRYPAIKVIAPRGSRTKVEEVISVDGTYEDFPADPSVRFEPLRGIKDVEGVMLVQSGDGMTVVLNDVVFNMDPKKDFLGWFITSLLGSAPGPRISRLVKWVMVKDAAALRSDLERLAETPRLARVVVAHEKVATGAGAAQALKTAAAMLG